MSRVCIYLKTFTYHMEKSWYYLRKIYTSIDIGTNSIKFVVGEYFNHKVYVLASHSVDSKGIKKGLIVEPGLVVEAIQERNKWNAWNRNKTC